MVDITRKKYEIIGVRTIVDSDDILCLNEDMQDQKFASDYSKISFRPQKTQI